MTIANVIEKGLLLHVFDERGRLLFAKAKGDGLQGYTSTTVSIRQGPFIFTYDEKGRLVGTISAR